MFFWQFPNKFGAFLEAHQYILWWNYTEVSVFDRFWSCFDLLIDLYRSCRYSKSDQRVQKTPEMNSSRAVRISRYQKFDQIPKIKICSRIWYIDFRRSNCKSFLFLYAYLETFIFEVSLKINFEIFWIFIIFQDFQEFHWFSYENHCKITYKSWRNENF